MIEKAEVLSRIAGYVNDLENEELAELYNEAYAIQETDRIEDSDIDSQQSCILIVEKIK